MIWQCFTAREERLLSAFAEIYRLPDLATRGPTRTLPEWFCNEDVLDSNVAFQTLMAHGCNISTPVITDDEELHSRYDTIYYQEASVQIVHH